MLFNNRREKIKTVKYADDLAEWLQLKNSYKNVMDRINQARKEYETKINVDKSKIMKVFKQQRKMKVVKEK